MGILTASYNWGIVVGVRGDARHNSTAGTITNGIGVYGYTYLQHASGTGVAFAGAYNFYAAGSNRIAGSTATITSQYGIGVMNQGAAWVGTAYGLYIVAQSGATTNYPIYSADATNPCYFACDIDVRGKAKGIGAQLIDFTAVDATNYLDMTGTLQDVPGVTYTATPTVAEFWYVWAQCEWNLAAGTGACNAADPLEGRLIVDTVARSPATWMPSRRAIQVLTEHRTTTRFR